MLLDFLRKNDINKGIEAFKETKGAVLLDVRTKGEYLEGHIPGSINIDVGEIGKADLYIENKAAPVYVYCYSGSRSGMAVTALKKMGYTNVRNIGGISAYTGSIQKGA
ncbi:rhodanese-like domain-containing protein [Eubacteriales bacterium OttesenSCG-928-N13]|nr:rhodanese-like domain-containing protein [Eubacteriales bacterium OttesenSCG-928-N13]